MDCCSISTFSIDWVAVSALGVAIISVVMGIIYNRKTLRLTEAHNKKTVEPLITDFFVADAMLDQNKNSTASYHIKNCGLGPAIIKSFCFKLNDNVYNHIFAIYKTHLGEPRYLTDLSSVFTLEVNHILASNESLNLFDLRFKDLESYMPFINLMINVSFELEYQTIYNDEKTFTKQHLITIK